MAQAHLVHLFPVRFSSGVQMGFLPKALADASVRGSGQSLWIRELPWRVVQPVRCEVRSVNLHAENVFVQSYQIGGRLGSVPGGLEVPPLEVTMFSMAKIAYHPFLVAVYPHVDSPPGQDDRVSSLRDQGASVDQSVRQAVRLEHLKGANVQSDPATPVLLEGAPRGKEDHGTARP